MYREMDFTVRNYTSRVELRKTVVFKFLEETPGLGRGDDASHYRYNMEILSDGFRVLCQELLAFSISAAGADEAPLLIDEKIAAVGALPGQVLGTVVLQPGLTLVAGGVFF